MLGRLRCIQLDPLDAVGTNADLVAMARIAGLRKGDVYRHLLPGHAFEHFAKERCLLPASAFAHYRDQAAETPWWRLAERNERLPASVVDAVEHEIRCHGPKTARDLEDHGAVEAMDWSGWKGTGKATTMALEVLWTQCRLVVSERTTRGKRYDLPERSLGAAAHDPAGEFGRWALLERVEAAGLLAFAGGPCWSMLGDVRTSGLPEELVREGVLEAVRVEGSGRPYLAPAGFRSRRFAAQDERMRILGPLDPVLWDRKLVAQAFGFEYVWEVYKPEAKRRFGWYVCPLLHHGRLVGRLEGKVTGDVLRVTGLWAERPDAFDLDALDACLEVHAGALGAKGFRRPKRARPNPR